MSKNLYPDRIKLQKKKLEVLIKLSENYLKISKLIDCLKNKREHFRYKKNLNTCHANKWDD